MKRSSRSAAPSSSRPAQEAVEAPPLPAAVAAARDEAPLRPGRELLRWILRDGLGAPAALFFAFLAAASAIVIEALLFRSLLELAPLFGLTEYRVGVVVALLALHAHRRRDRLGRRHGRASSRSAFRDAAPRRVSREAPETRRSLLREPSHSDMAERQHSIHTLRTLPRLVGRIARLGFELLLTTAAIIWLEPSTAPVVSLAVVASIADPARRSARPLRARPARAESCRWSQPLLPRCAPRDSFRCGSTARERALRTEHESLLVEWARARLGLQRAASGSRRSSFALATG